MDIIEQLRELLIKVGVNEADATTYNFRWPLAGKIMDSMEYSEFMAAVEDRFDVVFDKQGDFFVRSLNDFKELIEENG